MPLLKVENLEVTQSKPGWRQQYNLLRDITVSIDESQVIALIGESGSGKTLFARSVVDLLPDHVFLTGGTIYYRDKNVCPTDLKKLRGRHIFYSPQNAATSFNPVVKIGRQIMETSRLSYEKVVDIFIQLGTPQRDIERLLRSYPFQLSGGENQKCLLVLSVAQAPHLLVLDEPTSSMDTEQQDRCTRFLKKTGEEMGFALLVITHSLSMVRQLADYIYVMNKGKIVEEGEKEVLLCSPVHEYTREIVQYMELFAVN